MTQAVFEQPVQGGLNPEGRRRIIFIAIYTLFMQALPFVAAGTAQWPEAWVRAGMSLAFFFVAGVYLVRNNPGVINERGRKTEKMRSWDKAFAIVYTPVVLFSPVLAGLDRRFDWSDVPFWLSVAGALICIPAYILPYWAMAANRFLATTVKVQSDRGHTVITGGPYRIVRHPMYLGAVLCLVGEPLLLSSWWALTLGVFGVAAIVFRTSREDQTLQAELRGYTAFTEKTHYRLLPGIW